MGKFVKMPGSKEVLHCEPNDDGGGCERYTSIAQANDEEKAHFLVVCANDYFDYMDEADATNSTIWRPENINRDHFLNTLIAIREHAEVLNLFKKLLVRGKVPEELQMKMPLLHESLAVEFDPANTPDTTINVLHGAIGVITEAGEVADLLIRAIEDGDRDDVNVMEECGDLRWYIARMLRGIDKTDRDCERANINKLRGRHGVTFDAERDANRDLVLERSKLEKDFGAPLLELPDDPRAKELADPRSLRDQDKHRESSDELSAMAARVLSDPEASATEKSLAASVLSQDEHKGKRNEHRDYGDEDASLAKREAREAALDGNVGKVPQVPSGVKPLPPTGARG